MRIPIKEVVSITGSPGLHRVVKTDDKAIVVESLDTQRKRQLIKGNMLVSKLTDVSIYTTTDSEPLINVLRSIREKYPDSLPVSRDSDKQALLDFLGSVLPAYDAERVYPSNVKKLVTWYEILTEMEVDLTEETPDEAAAPEPPAPETEADVEASATEA